MIYMHKGQEYRVVSRDILNPFTGELFVTFKNSSEIVFTATTVEFDKHFKLKEESVVKKSVQKCSRCGRDLNVGGLSDEGDTGGMCFLCGTT